MTTPRTPLEAATIRAALAPFLPTLETIPAYSWTKARELHALYDELAETARPYEEAERTKMGDPILQRLRYLHYERLEAGDDRERLAETDAKIAAAEAERAEALAKAKAFLANADPVQAGRAE